LVGDYEITGDLVLRLLAQEERHPAFQPLLQRGRHAHEAWVNRIFSEPLDALTGAARDARVAQLVAATDVFTWKLWRRDRGMPARKVADLMFDMTARLNAPAAGRSR
ncbi:MAG TPA: hypothetical protein VIS74_07380, partial [Chthoniobacterales bacterium]